MRFWVRGVFAAAAIGAAAMASPSLAEPLRVMTFNIRYATKSDGEDQWQNRREMLAKVVRDFDLDVLGVQEALREQMDDLAAALPGYASVGVGREANGGGEYSAIFYRRVRFDLEAADTFWLSDTPTTAGSRTWGNTLPRICTWARLVDRTDGRRVSLFNTHWDHQSQPARLESGKLMGARIAERLAAGDPVVVTGDFNSPEGNPALAELTHQGKMLLDTFRVAHPDEKDVGTAHGFKGGVSGAKIDYIGVNDAWKVSDAAIVRTHEGRRYPSDHYAVTAVIELKTEK
jgi:endonuclease/exonuclease/phosphatase family metal-dependent hydrolase